MIEDNDKSAPFFRKLGDVIAKNIEIPEKYIEYLGNVDIKGSSGSSSSSSGIVDSNKVDSKISSDDNNPDDDTNFNAIITQCWWKDFPSDGILTTVRSSKKIDLNFYLVDETTWEDLFRGLNPGMTKKSLKGVYVRTFGKNIITPVPSATLGGLPRTLKNTPVWNLTYDVSSLTLYWDSKSKQISFDFDYILKLVRLDFEHGIWLDEDPHKELNLFNLLDNSKTDLIGKSLALSITYGSTFKLNEKDQEDYYIWKQQIPNTEKSNTTKKLPQIEKRIIDGNAGRIDYINLHGQIYKLYLRDDRRDISNLKPINTIMILVRPRLKGVFHVRKKWYPTNEDYYGSTFGKDQIESLRNIIEYKTFSSPIDCGLTKFIRDQQDEIKYHDDDATVDDNTLSRLFEPTDEKKERDSVREKILLRYLPRVWTEFLQKDEVKPKFGVNFADAVTPTSVDWIFYNESVTIRELLTKHENFVKNVLSPQPSIIVYRETAPDLAFMMTSMMFNNQRAGNDVRADKIIHALVILRKDWDKTVQKLIKDNKSAVVNEDGSDNNSDISVEKMQARQICVWKITHLIWEELKKRLKEDGAGKFLYKFIVWKYYGWNKKAYYRPNSMFFQNTTYSLVWNATKDELSKRKTPKFEYWNPSQTPLTINQAEYYSSNENNMIAVSPKTEAEVSMLELERLYGLIPSDIQVKLITPEKTKIQFYMLDKQRQYNDPSIIRCIAEHLYVAIRLGQGFTSSASACFREGGKEWRKQIKIDDPKDGIPELYAQCVYHHTGNDNINGWHVKIFCENSAGKKDNNRIEIPLTTSYKQTDATPMAVSLHLFSAFPVDDEMSSGIYKLISWGVLELHLSNVVELGYDKTQENIIVDASKYLLASTKTGTRIEIFPSEFQSSQVKGMEHYYTMKLKGGSRKDIPMTTYTFHARNGEEFKIKPKINTMKKKE